MTVTELHARLQEIIDEGNGDMPIVIQAMTGKLRGHSNPHIDKVFYGFDWDNGKVIINPTETLLGAAYSERRRESARKAGERKSNG